ncbi:MAG: hypothetical protein BGO55_20075 [Sphingobacteriales bacterium 50-39]|nr:O-antigen ligase family protein [Sphingobacteriales bacterium]OJW59000.1 MAG: hypothetical protein BGO55_20075 [Sphingobacteriales bacterium 50-39]
MMDNAIRNTWWTYTEKMRDLLYCGFFFLMPFTQALTFNLGFPFKLSEIALFLLAPFYLLLKRRIPLPRSIIYTIGLLFFIISASELINLFYKYPYALRTYKTRFGYTGDSITRYVYFVLALLTFFVATDMFLTHRRRYINIWLYGAVLAAVYAWYLAIFSFLNLPVFLLPGMTHPPQEIVAFHRQIIRCGTFLEGNMMSLYLFLSGAMAFYSRKYKTGIFLLFTVFTTFSTLSIISVFIFLILYLQKHIFRKKYLVYALPALVLIFSATFLFTKTEFYKFHVYNKLFSNADKADDPQAYSKADRIFSIKDAYNMGVGNPVWGVGLANYSRHYDRYQSRGNLDERLYVNFQRINDKVIPNNIYLELWSETGAISLLIFVLFLAILLSYARKDSSRALFPALICMMICFMAYPSFIMIYLWAFMALPVADHVLNIKKPEPASHHKDEPNAV